MRTAWKTAWKIAVPFVTVMAALGLAGGCKSNDIDNASNNTTNNNTNNQPPAANVIGTQGGIVNGPDGTSVRIPPGALTKDTAISITAAEPGQYPPLASSYTTLTKVYAFEPHGLKFLTPAILTVPFTAPAEGVADVKALRADPQGAWAPITAQLTSEAEITTGSFSYYTVVSTKQAVDAGPSCSGRGPNAAAPQGTVSNLTGTCTYQNRSLAMSTVVDGYASGQGDGGLEVYLTNYAKACGYAKNGVVKMGTKFLQLFVFANPVTTQTYTSQFYVGVFDSSDPGAEAGACYRGGGDGSPATGSITITALDGTHVAGSFSVDNGAGAISGNFDVPICSRQANLSPAECCTP